MKNITKFLILVISMFFPFWVKADGPGCFGQISGSNNVYIGDTFIYDVGLEGYTGGIIGIFGYNYSVSFDVNVLEVIEVGSYNKWEKVEYDFDDNNNLIVSMSTSVPTRYFTEDNTSSMSMLKIGYIKFKVKESSTNTPIIINDATVGNAWRPTDGGELQEDYDACYNDSPKTIININAKNKDTSLKSLSVDNYSLNPNFSPNVDNYKLSVKYAVSQINVKAVCNGTDCKVEGFGKKDLNVGDNTIKVIVTAQSGDKKTYTIIVTREKDTRSSDATLKNLEVVDIDKNEVISNEFYTTKTDYMLVVPYDTKKIKFNISSNHEKAKFNEIDNYELKVGNNEFKITVTAENGTQKIYKYIIEREEEEKQRLSELKVGGYTLNPSFSKDTYNYSIDIDENIDTIIIDYTKEFETSNVKITGNENIKSENIDKIEIEVTGENEKNKSIYTIKLNKITTVKPDNKDENDNSLLLIICGIVAAASVIAIAYVVITKKKKNK